MVGVTAVAVETKGLSWDLSELLFPKIDTTGWVEVDFQIPKGHRAAGLLGRDWYFQQLYVVLTKHGLNPDEDYTLVPDQSSSATDPVRMLFRDPNTAMMLKLKL